MSAIPSTLVAERHANLYRKLSWRLLPFLLLCYTFAYLDRVNIGFAKLQMQADLGFSDAVYGLGAGIFFLGYVLFEIPSNLLLPRIGARKTISRIMVLWGITSAAMLFVRNEPMFYAMRFLLGVFEAGFAPGMIFYLTYWYGRSRMAQVMAIVMLAGPIGGMFGGPLSTWVMTSFSGAHGLDGWQWMFLIEGLPCVILGVLALFVLDDRPADASWLSDDEKHLLASELDTSGSHHSFAQVAKDPRVYLMAVPYFCFICGIYAVSFWLPSIIKAAGVKDTMQIGLYSSIPYLASAIAMTLIGRSSDRRGERRYHSAIPALMGSATLALATYFGDQLSVALTCITIATAMMWVAYTVFWAMPSEYLKGDAASGGIALINTLGLTGGFLSPTIIGWAQTVTGSLHAGLYVMVALLAIGALVLIAMRPARGS
ncbi:MFS transporter [Paraburkholderia fynbosensis]|uniref:Metabolite transport protein NicT n=1 Tax=Paraburkholderia fynbosensis TaxID=1200993 RepID=A0A6J5FTK7_9BURK|nr:MFS transporter [Paraburkholderia fynbosensis]CAB3786765.1 Putative metabolite transport protein NicT [Paraburkholderia fynbosensis]